jgi:arsenate reductase
MSDKRRVLFLCTANCVRSQMAEGLLRHLAGDRFTSLSAGARPTGYVHELAIAAMGELGIDITGHRSKSIFEFLPPGGEPPDLVISVCSAADRECPVFPGRVQRQRWPFFDPVGVPGDRETRLRAFRLIRDEIRERLETALATGELENGQG